MEEYSVHIDKDNFREVMVSVVNANKNCDYEPMCFSTRDVVRKIQADKELSEIENRLEEAGVNLYEHLRPIYIEMDQGWNYVYYPESHYETMDKELPEDLSISSSATFLYTGVYDDTKHHYIPSTSPEALEAWSKDFLP